MSSTLRLELASVTSIAPSSLLATTRVHLWLLDAAHASVTVYGQIPLGITSAATSQTTVAAAYNTTVLIPPAIPDPAPATSFTLTLQSTSTGVTDLSIPVPGTFFGFSVEMSVITQLCESYIQVPLLNLFSNIRERAGAVHVRVGGNTQEYAYYVPTLPEERAISKESANSTNPTQTPAVIYTMDLFYLLANISAHVNVHWYLGVPFNDTSDFRLQIVEYGEAILGDHLLGIQVGNEPDLYAAHDHRNSSYSPQNYANEFGEMVDALAADSNVPVKNNLIGPSVSGTWTPEMVWDTGFITDYLDNLFALSVEHYPTDNCFPEYGIGVYHDPQVEFSDFLNHTSGVALCEPYLNSTAIAQTVGKPFLMFETNSASCGGFPGISDSFGGALWALDYGLQMAYSNFSGAMLHVGGQDDYYNYYEWTVGAGGFPLASANVMTDKTPLPVYYSALIASEVFGSTNTSQILDLHGNDDNIYGPQYAIYENGALARVALFNFITDPSGANTYTATITVDGGTVPSSVGVKYFLSPSVSTKDNITWAGQTLGTIHEVDGRFQGALNVTTISCDTGANTCLIPVPAPAFALVFLTAEETISTVTFSTTTSGANTATIAASVLATSNGMSGAQWQLGSTSDEKSAARARKGTNVALYVFAGATLVVFRLAFGC
ncbi:glycoside hydrolase family 79 protein [Mycena maculata]|uniref:Glycoside hydrolase family 79 protein n=1 Tax=Mycena maculata TaxID=230809 RepID=A0AAD7HZM3_9AGAR|nr:glycoside hydrolase family 79 protein [Mycena maculata]